MKYETSVGKEEFHSLYCDESNAKEASLWITADNFFEINGMPVYSRHTSDCIYYMTLCDEFHIGYCMMLEFCPTKNLRVPYELSVWTQESIDVSLQTTDSLVAMVMRDHDLIINGDLSKYGEKTLRRIVCNALENGNQVGYPLANHIVDLDMPKFKEAEGIWWGLRAVDPVKLIIRKTNDQQNVSQDLCGMRTPCIV